MDNFLVVLFSNAISATILAFVAALVTRFSSRPPVIRFFWFLVLLKLLTPPVFEIPLAPVLDPFEPNPASVSFLGGDGISPDMTEPIHYEKYEALRHRRHLVVIPRSLISFYAGRVAEFHCGARCSAACSLVPRLSIY